MEKNIQKYTITSKSEEYLLANIYSTNDRYMISPVFITSEEFVKLYRLAVAENMYHKIDTVDIHKSKTTKFCELTFNNITIELNGNEIEDVIKIEIEFVNGNKDNIIPMSL